MKKSILGLILTISMLAHAKFIPVKKLSLYNDAASTVFVNGTEIGPKQSRDASIALEDNAIKAGLSADSQKTIGSLMNTPQLFSDKMAQLAVIDNPADQSSPLLGVRYSDQRQINGKRFYPLSEHPFQIKLDNKLDHPVAALVVDHGQNEPVAFLILSKGESTYLYMNPARLEDKPLIFWDHLDNLPKRLAAKFAKKMPAPGSFSTIKAQLAKLGMAVSTKFEYTPQMSLITFEKKDDKPTAHQEVIITEPVITVAPKGDDQSRVADETGVWDHLAK